MQEAEFMMLKDGIIISKARRGTPGVYRSVHSGLFVVTVLAPASPDLSGTKTSSHPLAEMSELKIGIMAVAALSSRLTLIVALGGEGGFLLADAKPEGEICERAGVRRGSPVARGGCHSWSRHRHRVLGPRSTCFSRCAKTCRSASGRTRVQPHGSVSLLGEGAGRSVPAL